MKNPLPIRFYCWEIERQCSFALCAVLDMEFYLRDHPAAPNHDTRLGVFDKTRFWSSVQAFLVSTANLSNLLYGGKGAESKKRAKILRGLFNVNDKTPLAHNRILRDHFVHFDERIDKWAEVTKTRVLADSIISSPKGLPKTIKERHLPKRDYGRFFDPKTWILSYRSDKLEFLPLCKQIIELRKAVYEREKVSQYPFGFNEEQFWKNHREQNSEVESP